MKVDVYANLQKDCVSVRSRETEDYGKVVEHRPKVTVTDAEFVIQEGSQQTCRENGTKNVHAVVRGKWNDSAEVRVGEKVVYNPFEYDRFTEEDSGRGVARAERATVTRKAVFAKGLRYSDDKVEV